MRCDASVAPNTSLARIRIRCLISSQLQHCPPPTCLVGTTILTPARPYRRGPEKSG